MGKIIRERIKKLPPSDDYSNFKNDPRARPLTMQILKGQRLDNTIVVIDNTIVVIDNKIYRLDSKEYLELNRGDSLIVKPTIIKDTTSQTAIKYILIFKTKNNPK